MRKSRDERNLDPVRGDPPLFGRIEASRPRNETHSRRPAKTPLEEIDRRSGSIEEEAAAPAGAPVMAAARQARAEIRRCHRGADLLRKVENVGVLDQRIADRPAVFDPADEELTLERGRAPEQEDSIETRARGVGKPARSFTAPEVEGQRRTGAELGSRAVESKGVDGRWLARQSNGRPRFDERPRSSEPPQLAGEAPLKTREARRSGVRIAGSIGDPQGRFAPRHGPDSRSFRREAPRQVPGGRGPARPDPRAATSPGQAGRSCPGPGIPSQAAQAIPKRRRTGAIRSSAAWAPHGPSLGRACPRRKGVSRYPRPPLPPATPGGKPVSLTDRAAWLHRGAAPARITE